MQLFHFLIRISRFCWEHQVDSAIPFLIFVPSSPAHAIYSQGVGNPSFNSAILTIFYLFKKRGPRWTIDKGRIYGCPMMQYICRRWSSLFDIGCDLKHYRFRWMILAHPHPSLTRVRICGVYGSILTKAKSSVSRRQICCKSAANR